MCRRRGLSLAELMISAVMVVVLTAASASLYLYATKRVAAQGAESAVQMQANMLATEIMKMVGQAKSCKIVTSGPNTALVCQMPATGTDEDFDGVLDHFVPDGSSGGKEIFNTGVHVWFYMSDNTGTWGVSGTRIWRAVVNGSGSPGPGDKDVNWTRYYGGDLKWKLIDSVTFTVDPVAQVTSFTIEASSLNRADRSATTDANAPGSRFKATWTAFWQNFRNMIVNGGFEYPDVSGSGWGYFAGDGLTGGWVKTSTGPVEIQYGGFGANSFSGKQHLELDADVPGSIKQTIITEPGMSYALSFYYTPRPGCNSNRIRVKWNGATIDILDGSGSGLPASAAWTLKSYVVASGGTTSELEFIDESTSGDKTGGLLDNVVMMPN